MVLCKRNKKATRKQKYITENEINRTFSTIVFTQLVNMQWKIQPWVFECSQHKVKTELLKRRIKMIVLHI